MAEIKSTPLGKPRGKVGNIIYREIRGKIFAYVRPSKWKVSYSPASIEARRKFKVFNGLLKEFKKLTDVPEVWQLKYLPKALFQRSKTTLKGRFNDLNFHTYFTTGEIGKICLSPVAVHCGLIKKDVSVTGNKIIITVNVPDIIIDIDETEFNKVIAQGIVELKDPQNAGHPETAFIPLIMSGRYRDNDDLIFHFILYDKDYEYFKDYSVRNFVMNLYIKNFYRTKHYFTGSIGGII